MNGQSNFLPDLSEQVITDGLKSLDQMNELKKVATTHNVQYSGRPITASLEEATLGGHAHIILPGLFLGSMESASQTMLTALRSLRVTAVVNATRDFEAPCSHEKDGIEYARIAISDNEAAQLRPFLPGAAEFIHRHISAGHACLVHCQRGVSRSASIVMAYLMLYRGMSRDEAYIWVKRRRSVIAPNIGFWNQLVAFEEDLKRGLDMGFFESSINESWCLQSFADFSTKRGSTFIAIRSASAEVKIEAITAALDFVLGRNLATSDVAWLCALCRECDTITGGAVACLTSVITDPDFLDRWESDFSAARLKQLLNGLSVQMQNIGQ
jgi:atypical dual specificity phosphatase